MTPLLKQLCFLAALALLPLQSGFAQDQTNLDVFVFGPPAIPVWDISGVYQITNHTQGTRIKPLDIVFKDVAINVDGQGKVEGGGTILVLIGESIVGGDYKVTGKMSGGGDKARANFTIKFKGNGTVAGVVTTCKINPKYNLEIDAPTLTMAGKTTGSANFTHIGGGSLKGDIVLPLPAGVDGGWNVTLDPLPLGNKISGTAIILVDNIPANTLNAKIKGNIPKGGPAKVKLTGTGNSKGTQLNMQFTPLLGATNLAAKINGKILGQKVKN